MPQRRKSSVKRAAKVKMQALRAQAERAAAQLDPEVLPTEVKEAEPVSPPLDTAEHKAATPMSVCGSEFDTIGLGGDEDCSGFAYGSHTQCPVRAVQARFQHGNRWVGTAQVSHLLRECPMWVHQRPVDTARVQEIANTVAGACNAACDTSGEYAPCPLPGSVSVFCISESPAVTVAPPQQCGIIDGQHRVLALHGLITGEIQPQTHAAPAAAAAAAAAAADTEDGDHDMTAPTMAWIPPKDIMVIVDVYRLDTWSGVKELFLQLNRAETIPEIDLPEAIAPEHKNIIDTAVETLMERYPACFSTSSRCRPPHLHGPSLRGALHRTGLVKRKRLSTLALLAEIQAANDSLSTLTVTSFPVASRGRALRKAKVNGFYLGLTPSWLDRLGSL